uniref:Uncharacterized protein n=1 Tax=Oryza brachyantha TaxID=4533 RepID=J3MIP6_ORYBR
MHAMMQLKVLKLTSKLAYIHHIQICSLTEASSEVVYVHDRPTTKFKHTLKNIKRSGNLLVK